MSNKNLILFLVFLIGNLLATSTSAQKNLDYFLSQSKIKNPVLAENNNFEKLIELQSKLINIQNKSIKVNFTSEVYFSPYFNNNGNIISITNTPDSKAIGYDANVSNGGLYSAQLNISKNLLNKRVVENLQLQNSLQLGSAKLTNEKIIHDLEKIITDNYIIAFQIQSQKEFLNREIIEIKKRISLFELLTKKGIFQISDYLLVQLDLKSKITELDQVESNFNSAVNQLYSLCNLEYNDTIVSLLEPSVDLNNTKYNLFIDKKFINDSLQIESNILVFNNQYKPQLNLYGNIGVNSTDIRNIYRHFGISGGVRLIVPIYDGGQKKNFSQQQRIYQENLIANKESYKTQLDNNLKNIQSQIVNSKDNIKSINEQLEMYSKILKVYKIKIENGQVSILDFLNISRNYRQTEYLKIQIQTNLWLLYNQFNYTNW